MRQDRRAWQGKAIHVTSAKKQKDRGEREGIRNKTHTSKSHSPVIHFLQADLLPNSSCRQKFISELSGQSTDEVSDPWDSVTFPKAHYQTDEPFRGHFYLNHGMLVFSNTWINHHIMCSSVIHDFFLYCLYFFLDQWTISTS